MALPIISLFINPLGLTQFDLGDNELQSLRSRRWNFSSSTTRISLEESAEPASGSSSSAGPDVGPNNNNMVNPTVGEVYQHLNIKEMVLKMEDKEAGASISSIEDLDSPFVDSHLPLESPLVNPMEHPLVRSSSTAASDGGIKITVSSPGDKGDGENENKAPNINSSPVSSVGISASILKVKTELREVEKSAPNRNDMINSLQILGLVSPSFSIPVHL